MEWSRRVVTQIPVSELWTSEGSVAASRERQLGEEDIKGLLRAGPVEFVVLDCGVAPRWIDEAECFSFWNEEVKAHLVPLGRDGLSLEDFPGEYAYVAWEWRGDDARRIVTLETSH